MTDTTKIPHSKTVRDDILGSDVRNVLPVGIRLHGAKKLHASGLKGQGIKIGILDSGIDKDHVGFNDMENTIEQYWYRHNVDDTKGFEHGTHVAGTIHTMAPSSDIIDYRCFGDNTSTGYDVNTGVAHAIIQAYLDGCHIINLSCGTKLPNSDILTACKYVADHGMIIVCAAGNEGDENIMTNEFCYPAPFPETIAVGAVSKKDGLPHAYFSNTNPKIDVAAVGEGIVSYKAMSNDKYIEMDGTSMACPHITGFVACLLSEGSEHREEVLLERKKALLGEEDDDTTACERLKSILADKYTIDIGLPGFDNETGLGFCTYLSKNELNDEFRTEGIQIQNSAGRFGSHRGIMRKPRYTHPRRGDGGGRRRDGRYRPPGVGDEVVSRLHPSQRPNTPPRRSTYANYRRRNPRRRSRSRRRRRRRRYRDYGMAEEEEFSDGGGAYEMPYMPYDDDEIEFSSGGEEFRSGGPKAQRKTIGTRKSVRLNPSFQGNNNRRRTTTVVVRDEVKTETKTFIDSYGNRRTIRIVKPYLKSQPPTETFIDSDGNTNYWC